MDELSVDPAFGLLAKGFIVCKDFFSPVFVFAEVDHFIVFVDEGDSCGEIWD